MFCCNNSNPTSSLKCESHSCLQKPVTRAALFVISVLFAGGAIASHFTNLGTPGIVAFSIASAGSSAAFIAACVRSSSKPRLAPKNNDQPAVPEQKSVITQPPLNPQETLQTKENEAPKIATGEPNKPKRLGPSKITWQAKDTAKVSFASPSDKIQWIEQNQYVHPFNMLCFDADYDNRAQGVIFRVKLQHLNVGATITDVLQQAGLRCEGVPTPYTKQAILDNLSQEYRISGHRYKIEKLITCHGCYGDVFLARDIDTKEQVAIKVLRVDEDQEAFEMNKMHQKGGHRNIVRYIGDARVMEKTWIVMEYIQGETMGRLQNRGKWNADLERQRKEGESFMRLAGVRSERENDQENVLVTMIDGKQVVKLIDFGTLARS